MRATLSRCLPPVGRKITLQMPSDFNDEDLQFAQQIGVQYVNTGTTGGTYETFADIKRRVEAVGLKVSNIGNTSVHNMPEVTLNLPGRDEKIAEYKQYLRNLEPRRYLLHHLRAHGQRHLEFRARNDARRRTGSILSCQQRGRPLDEHNFQTAADPRP